MSAANISIRPATRADLPYIAEVQARSAWGDEIHGFLAVPGRSYEQWHRFILIRVRQRFVTSGFKYMVGVANETNQIVGFISLQIESSNGEPNKLQEQWTSPPSLLDRIEVAALKVEKQYYILLDMYGMSWDVYTAFGEASEKAVAHLHEPRMHCMNLNVLPGWQGMGVGGKLLRWAQNLARENGMGMSLQSSIVGIPAYKKLGFVDVGSVDVRLTENGPIVFQQPAMAWNLPENV